MYKGEDLLVHKYRYWDSNYSPDYKYDCKSKYKYLDSEYSRKDKFYCKYKNKNWNLKHILKDKMLKNIHMNTYLN